MILQLIQEVGKSGRHETKLGPKKRTDKQKQEQPHLVGHGYTVTPMSLRIQKIYNEDQRSKLPQTEPWARYL